MTSVQFCYWVQGFFEISEATTLTEKQVEQIKKHLAMVFTHEIDPSHGDKEMQNKLNTIHHGLPPWPTNIPTGGFPSENDVVYRC